MDEYHITRMVLMAEVSGGRVQLRPGLGWMDGMKVALGKRGMTVQAVGQFLFFMGGICRCMMKLE